MNQISTAATYCETLPETARAVFCDQPGGTETLELRAVVPPRPGPTQVLIRVEVAGVNRPDLLQRAGLYPPPPGANPNLGLEVAGRIVGIGPEVKREWLGRQVTALVPGGGYADYCVTYAGHCLPYPDGFDSVMAGILPEACFTIFDALFIRGKLAAGDRVLIHGGTSGIGTLAIQIAKAHGATVMTTCGSAEKCQLAAALGAHWTTNYRLESWHAGAEAFLSKYEARGFDLIVDMVAGNYTQPGLKLLAHDGRYVMIALQRGAQVNLDLRRILTHRLVVTGTTMRPQSVQAKASIAQRLLQGIWPLFDAGFIRPVLYKTWPLERVSEAHAAMERGEHTGKLALIAARPA